MLAADEVGGDDRKLFFERAEFVVRSSPLAMKRMAVRSRPMEESRLRKRLRSAGSYGKLGRLAEWKRSKASGLTVTHLRLVTGTSTYREEARRMVETSSGLVEQAPPSSRDRKARTGK